jgi:hypothetical protein
MRTDLIRFSYYADRVDRIVISKGDLAEVGEAVLSGLLVSSSHGRLLPNLRRLVNWEGEAAYLPYTRLFLYPGLTTFSLEVPREASAQRVRMIVQDLSSRCKTLEELDIHEYFDLHAPDRSCYSETLPLWCDYALSLSSLTRLSVGNAAIPLAVLERLALMPRLRKLFLMETALDSLFTLAAQSGALFPAIRTIYASCDRPQLLVPVLANISSPTFETLVVRSDTPPCSAAVLQSIVQTLASRPMANQLSQLAVRFEKRLPRPLDPDTEASYTITLDTLQPLLSLGALESLELSVGPVAADDDMLSAMAASWPNLRELTLGCQHRSVRDILAGDGAVTIAGVARLVSRCSDLVLLNVMLDVSSAHAWTFNSQPALRACVLPYEREPSICFQHSRLKTEDVEPLARALASIFPAPWQMGRSPAYMDIIPDVQEDEARRFGQSASHYHDEKKARTKLWNGVCKRMAVVQRSTRATAVSAMMLRARTSNMSS